MRSFVLSFGLSVSRITHERVNGRRPNIVDMGKAWPYRSFFSVDPDGSPICAYDI